MQREPQRAVGRRHDRCSCSVRSLDFSLPFLFFPLKTRCILRELLKVARCSPARSRGAAWGVTTLRRQHGQPIAPGAPPPRHATPSHTSDPLRATVLPKLASAQPGFATQVEPQWQAMLCGCGQSLRRTETPNKKAWSSPKFSQCRTN